MKALPIRIGVNALYLIPGGVGGTEIYLRELLAALSRIDSVNEYFIFTNAETGRDLVPNQANFHHEPQSLNAAFRPARLLWEQTVLPVRVKRRGVRVLLNPGFTSPVFCSCPTVTVFHDLQHIRHPEFFRRFDLPFWRLMLWLSARRSQHLIAVSESTSTDLRLAYGSDADRVAVIPHGVDRRFYELDRTFVEPYLLCVSTLHPHKNIDRLLRAYARANLTKRLVCAGMRGFDAERLYTLRANLGLERSVDFTGWISRDDLLRTYERAHAFVYPSTFEGFGMPVLESMAAGIPTACSSIPVLRETGGDAVLYFDPHDEDAMVDALCRLSDDEELRGRLAIAGPVRARQYTWERTAQLTLELLMKVAGASTCSRFAAGLY